MYTIGRFSKICNVPVKTLRYYDEIDLLKPSYIDDETNYRYYDYDKIEAIKIILILKRLHISLIDIKKMIESADQSQWNTIFDQKISELEKQKIQLSKEIEEIKQLKIKTNTDLPITQGPLYLHVMLKNGKKRWFIHSVKKLKLNL